MKTIGVTGTRDGMTVAQVVAFTAIIEAVCEPMEFHHGDCVGVDDEAANIVRASGNLFNKIFVHPPILNDYRANNPHYDVIFHAKPYFERNRKIVDLCKRIIVIPKHTTWRATGGTWYTHDYAMKHKRWITVIWPNGTVTEIDQKGESIERAQPRTAGDPPTSSSGKDHHDGPEREKPQARGEEATERGSGVP